ncbi:MAG: hypothetical protein IKM52_03630, partial [Clostridia bacterium]|nr:hypothetical protein [Clostridia bacterium]
MVWWIIFGTLAFLILVAFCTVYICFYRIFLTHRKPKKNEAFDLPDGEEYRPHHERMVSWIKDIRAMPHTEASIVSFDGLTLYGKYYEYEKSAPIEQRVEDLMHRLTLEEKVSLLAGESSMTLHAIPRLGIPAIKVTDGPTG